MISIIIVRYRYNYVNRLITVVKSILRSTEKNIEIIICTDDAKKLGNYFKEKVKIIEVKSNKFKNNLGFYRNVAVKFSEGEYLYFTDADVVIYNYEYLRSLKKISKENGESVVIWPKMFRLDEGIEQFCKDFISGKNLKFPLDYDHCIYGYRGSNFYRISELKAEFEEVPYVCKPQDYSNLKEMKPEEFEELVWRPSIHWGGIFCRKDYFENVGGFSLEYFNWGCEDDDLIWKLTKMYKIIYLFKRFPNLSVLHLEHPRRYWTYYQNNMLIFEKRKHEDVNRIILEDKKRYDRISKDIACVFGGDTQ